MAGGDLDESVRQADPDRWLASRFIADPAKREAVLALLAFDAELARAPRVTSSPLAAQIRLTWWRDALEEMAVGRRPRAHPILEGLAGGVELGLTLSPLATDIEARIEALDGEHTAFAEPLAWADATAAMIAVASGTLLDPSAEVDALTACGRVIGLDQLRRIEPSPTLPALLAGSLGAAQKAGRRLRPEALPAVLAATLARASPRSGAWTGLDRRLRMLIAAITGQL